MLGVQKPAVGGAAAKPGVKKQGIAHSVLGKQTEVQYAEADTRIELHEAKQNKLTLLLDLVPGCHSLVYTRTGAWQRAIWYHKASRRQGDWRAPGLQIHLQAQANV